MYQFVPRMFRVGLKLIRTTSPLCCMCLAQTLTPSINTVTRSNSSNRSSSLSCKGSCCGRKDKLTDLLSSTVKELDA